MTSSAPFDEATAIAIVGMAGRFPRSPDVDSLWKNVHDGVECLTRFTERELEENGEDPARIRNPSYIPVSGALAGYKDFDAGFFGFSPRDASIMDPQHRHFLECSWEALENAGIDPEKFDGAIGVYGGSGHNAYLTYNLLTNQQLAESVGFFLLRHTGNDKDFLTTRVSYCLKLTGPSINIQTACSTSLVAVHVAAQSLLNGECDLALAGAVTIELPHGRGYLWEEGGIQSPDGHCRAFDVDSKGTLFGSGVGVVALRRYADAVESGDYVHAVIRGSAINNDGANKVGYLAPSVEGQATCIREAIELADMPPDTISYVECHGTGTPVGDPIEITALTQAFRADTDAKQFCGIGSIKTNIGHLDTAAGVASLVKTVEALKHKQLPPSLHYKAPNPVLNLEASPFFVNAELTPWETSGHPRRAGINSLGVGGTNAFVLVEEAPVAPPSGPSRPWQLLPLSARSTAACARAGERLANHLRAHGDANLADVAYSLATGRRNFAHRRVVVARDAADAVAVLEGGDAGRLFAQEADPNRKVAFLFPGGGAQYPNMARELYEHEAVYREEVDGCLALVPPEADYDLAKLLFPAPGDEDAAANELELGSRTLPALFVTEYALAKLFMSWGIEPAAMLGHSMGEYTAACLAGVFTPAEAMKLVFTRGRLFETLEPGAMLSVPLPANELSELMSDALDIAVVNTPTNTVASGPIEAIDELAKRLDEREIESRRIKIQVAAHSRMLEPILAEFREVARTIDFQPPEIPFLSNVTGTWITDAEACDPDYWVRHLRGTVRFSANLDELFADESIGLLEVAPGRTLCSLAKAHPGAGLGRPIINSLRHPKEEVSDLTFLLSVLGKLWLSGVDIDWHAYYGGEDRRRTPLPTYPFEHQPYWIEPGQTQVAPATRSLYKKPDIADWFYQPAWSRRLLPAAPSRNVDSADGGTRPWLVFVDDCGLGAKLTEHLRADQQTVVTVHAGDELAIVARDRYELRPGVAADYVALWNELEKHDLLPGRILHLWTVAGEDAPTGIEGYDLEQDRGFYSLLFLAQAIGQSGSLDPINLAVVSNLMQQVAGEPVHCPERATVLGPCKVITQEMPNVTCRSIDIVLPQDGSWQERLLLERIPQELSTLTTDHVIAYRGHDRFVQGFEAIKLAKPDETSSRLRDGGVYLVTGGLGGLGLELARHLHQECGAKLALLGRTELPPAEEWDRFLAQTPAEDTRARRVRGLAELRAAGVDFMVATGDVANLEQMQSIVADVRKRYGRINGVFHTAGVLDDSIIQLKSREQAEAVLRPKTMGTMVLDRALADETLDFMILFSSVSSFTGLAGQVDYAAANAFLDSFAHSKTDRDGTFTVAVNWNAWQKVGMAAELARTLGVGGTGAAERAVAHPLLAHCVRTTESERVYANKLGTASAWILDEHRIKGGRALMPGTGYLEIARAAVADVAAANGAPDPRALELRDVVFAAPFAVSNDESRELKTSLHRDGDAWRVSIESGGGQVHAAAEGELVDTPRPAPVSLHDIAKRCTQREQTFDSAADAHLDFGPRWNNRKKVAYGAREALATLELPAEFAGDSEHFALHPALMDFATAGAQELVPGYTADTHFFVPMSYGRLRIWAPLPTRAVSHIRLTDSSDDVASYDVTIYDTDGNTLVDVSGFVMRRIEDRTLMTEVSSAANAGSIEARADTAGAVRAEESKAATGNRILELGLAEGILPDEGMRALDRVLAAPMTAQVVVSSQDLEALMETTRAKEPWERGEDAAPTLSSAQQRPNLATPYVAPKGELGEKIVALWEELLGVQGIGVNDDFFDLGGHSLLMTQLVSRLRKRLEVDLPIRTLFQNRTVAGLVREIESSRGAEAKPTLKRVSREAYRVKSSE